MTEPNLAAGLIGGALIGIAAALLLLLNGRIAGVSGIFGGPLGPGTIGERAWRLAFIFGLIAGAGLFRLARGGLPLELQAGGLGLAIAGFLVGFGTRRASGCTSGHGVCGLARRSPRSVTATIIFMGGTRKSSSAPPQPGFLLGAAAPPARRVAAGNGANPRQPGARF